MTKEKVHGILQEYAQTLHEHWKTMSIRNQEASSLRQRLDHLHWMCLQAMGFAEEGKTDKMFRWLGFLQGAFWAMGLRSIETMKQENMPRDGESYDKEHV